MKQTGRTRQNPAIDPSDKYIVIATSDGRTIESQPTRKKAEKAAAILGEHNRNNGGKEYYRVNYARSADCPHYQDNQGLCHQCGIMMDEGLAIESGFYQPEP